MAQVSHCCRRYPPAVHNGPRQHLRTIDLSYKVKDLAPSAALQGWYGLIYVERRTSLVDLTGGEYKEAQ